MTTPQFCLKVWGEFACFTRPEMKVERVSYEVITPSAARAMFEAIFWKPPVQWQVTQIEVLKPIQFTTIRRNELSQVVSSSVAQQVMKKGTGNFATYIEEDRQQRAALVLKDVTYRLHARMDIQPEKLGEGETPQKFYEMFKRRAEKGQCFNQPYLGCREFSASFELIAQNSEADAEPGETPINESRKLNWMLYDMDFSGAEPMPMFFEAAMQDGIIKVPERNSTEVKR
jgi:CRISPR-associated protein Cas5d